MSLSLTPKLKLGTISGTTQTPSVGGNQSLCSNDNDNIGGGVQSIAGGSGSNSIGTNHSRVTAGTRSIMLGSGIVATSRILSGQQQQQPPSPLSKHKSTKKVPYPKKVIVSSNVSKQSSKQSNKSRTNRSSNNRPRPTDTDTDSSFELYSSSPKNVGSYYPPDPYDNRNNNGQQQQSLEQQQPSYVVSNQHLRWQHLYVLPVLLLEFTALALTRAVLPSLLLHEYGNHVYIVMGCADFVRGLLAFFACPLFGKISDRLGRRLCLFVTVLGTCAPVCSLALFSWEATVIGVSTTIQQQQQQQNDMTPLVDETTNVIDTTNSMSDYHYLNSTHKDDHNGNTNRWGHVNFEAFTQPSVATTATTSSPYAITVFVILLALSGVFSSTFTLVFAYISDTVRVQEERVSAYGLALATFGLSFTIGPMAGGYLAQTNPQYVFLTSFLLTVTDLLYIYAILPESRELPQQRTGAVNWKGRGGEGEDEEDESSTFKNNNQKSISAVTSASSVASFISSNDMSWNPFDSLQLILSDPFLRQVGKVAFFYYTALWALISTLSVYAVKQFHLTPNRLGELMSAIGLCTMVAEAVLVRIMVPLLGEKTSIKIGLVSFTLQCIVLGLAYQPWHLFVCAACSMLGNLVYPSLSSLVSGSVEPEMVGEALGAINGIKALTEGFGPLIFGSLMTISEHSVLPGWPYLLAAVLVVLAYKETELLPDGGTDHDSANKDEYIHELARKKLRQAERLRKRKERIQKYVMWDRGNGSAGGGGGNSSSSSRRLTTDPPIRQGKSPQAISSSVDSPTERTKNVSSYCIGEEDDDEDDVGGGNNETNDTCFPISPLNLPSMGGNTSTSSSSFQQIIHGQGHDGDADDDEDDEDEEIVGFLSEIDESWEDEDGAEFLRSSDDSSGPGQRVPSNSSWKR